jgi:hypothetical protein
MTIDNKRSTLIFAAIGVTIGFAAEVFAEPRKPLTENVIASTAGSAESVRIVGIPFVPNVNPRQR